MPRRFGLAITALVLWVALAALAGHARAEERILRFDSDVVIEASGALVVTETIRVQVEGQRIRRGIFRDFPTRYRDAQGNLFRVGFEVLDVARDGRPERFAEESIANGTRVRIGDPDVFLPNGPTTYTIRYRTTRQIGFFAEYDELYWNVTGNAWEFGIDHASVEITLPPGGNIRSVIGYTGPQGSSARDYRVTVETGPVMRAETTRPLDASEGFTIAVSFPKGLVPPPGEFDRRMDFIAEHLAAIIMGGGAAFVTLYFWFAWRRVGRDPEAGVVVPLFRPPTGIGAAGARFVREMGFDDKAFTAAVLGLAVKKRLTIEDHDGTYTLTPREGADTGLCRSEKALSSALGGSALALEQSNHKTVAAARGAVETSLKDEYLGASFVTNRGWFAMGAILSILVLIAAFVASGADTTGAAPGAIVGVCFIGAGLLIVRSIISGILGARGFWGIIGLFRYVFALPFLVATIGFPVGMVFTDGLSPNAIGILVGGVAVLVANLVFFNLLTARTEAGRKLADEIEGFRMYLATTEEDRLNVLHPPDKTPALFEKYLPYAIALGCENEWSERFAEVLRAANYTQPDWYVGNSWNPSRPATFASGIAGGLATATAASATAPGSSSGSSGGGFSGGGGGGGGGGGW